MKITIQRSALIEPLSQVVKAAATKSAIPILEGILIEVDESLILTCSDSALTIRAVIPFPGNHEPGSTVLPAKKLLEIVRKLPDEPITIQANESIAQIKCGTKKIKMSVQDPEEFPAMKQITARPIDLKGMEFAQMVESVAFAASQDENNQILKGVCMSIDHDRIEAVATNRHRLARYTIPMPEAGHDPAKIVIPTKVLDIVAKLRWASLHMLYTASEVHFLVGPYSIRSRLIDGTYPDTSKIIPSSHKTKVIIDRDELLQTLELAERIAETNTKVVILDIADSEVYITAKDVDMGLEESLDAEVEGDDMKLGVNAQYLIDAIKSIPSERVELHLTAAMSPILIYGDGDLQRTHLVLPYRLGST